MANTSSIFPLTSVLIYNVIIGEGPSTPQRDAGFVLRLIVCLPFLLLVVFIDLILSFMTPRAVKDRIVSCFPRRSSEPLAAGSTAYSCGVLLKLGAIIMSIPMILVFSVFMVATAMAKHAFNAIVHRNDTTKNTGKTAASTPPPAMEAAADYRAAMTGVA